MSGAYLRKKGEQSQPALFAFAITFRLAGVLSETDLISSKERVAVRHATGVSITAVAARTVAITVEGIILSFAIPVAITPFLLIRHSSMISGRRYHEGRAFRGNLPIGCDW